MSLATDIANNWRARPLRAATLATLCLMTGLLAGAGVWTYQRAARETASLRAAWPPDRVTLAFTTPPTRALYLELTRRLPPGSWTGFGVRGSTGWVDGTLAPLFFQGVGSALPPDAIARGERFALVSNQAPPDQRPGALLRQQGTMYRILGRGTFSQPVEHLLPAASAGPAHRKITQLEVRRAARDIQPLLRDLPDGDRVALVDHLMKRAEAGAGFRRLQAMLAAAVLVSALLTALVIRALLQAEVRERETEFALRRALGARPDQIRNLVLAEVGVTGALPLALALLPYLAVIQPPPVLATIGAGVGWILICTLLPATRAAALSPASALKKN